MKVEIAKSYPMPCAPEVAWGFLQDLEAVAGCMPGAKMTERLDDRRFKGTVTVRVGPATMSFRGEVEMKDIDAAARTLRLVGKGTDSTGSSGASLDLSARVDTAEGGHSTLVGTSEVSMSGKAVAFGGRMMTTVADQVLKQFADNFAARVAVLEAERLAMPSGSGAPAAAGGAPAAAVAKPSAAAPELNGLALAWAVLRSWLRSLFGRKEA
jgi:hypothetical protein